MGILRDPDLYFMSEALKLAEKAFDEDEVTVGAVVVSNNSIIARSHNLVEKLNDPTAHAEMQAITAACHHFGSKYLSDCTIYVTLEPCPMCAAALYWAQVGKIVYGAPDPKMGFSRYHNLLHPGTEINNGLLAAESSELLIRFFKGKR
jgi:tRNA(adenine34) deaminase